MSSRIFADLTVWLLRQPKFSRFRCCLSREESMSMGEVLTCGGTLWLEIGSTRKPQVD